MFCWLLSIPQAVGPNSSIIKDRHLEATYCCCFHIIKESAQAGRLLEWPVPRASPQKLFLGLPTHLLGLSLVKAPTQLSPWKHSRWNMLKGGFTEALQPPGIWKHFCHSSLPKIAVGEIETEFCCQKQVWVFWLMFGRQPVCKRGLTLRPSKGFQEPDYVWGFCPTAIFTCWQSAAGGQRIVWSG